MRAALLFIFLYLLLGCGPDKHLPSSNPPEFDPTKTYTPLPAQRAEPEQPPIQLPSLEPGPNEKGQWRNMPPRSEPYSALKDVKTACDALSQLAHGMGSTQLFAGADGAALKRVLGARADTTARIWDEEIARSLKQALGPTAENCPFPAQPRRSGALGPGEMPPRIILARGPASNPLVIAQGSPSQGPDGYTDTSAEQTVNAPPGWVGRTKTTRRIRVGNKPETEGYRSTIGTVLGGKVLKCPSSEGVVPGDFEYGVSMDETFSQGSVMRAVHLGFHAAATLKGQTGEDAKVQFIDADLSIAVERSSSDTPASIRRFRAQLRFVPSRSESFPGLPTQISERSASRWDSGDLLPQDHNMASDASLAVMFWASQTYLEAEQEWHKQNACVELTFTPATKKHRLSRNQSVQVRVELRTKKEQTVIPAQYKKVVEVPREGVGKVSPKEAESKPGAPAQFTYTAPSTRVRYPGFGVGVLSRAGVAGDKWEAAEGGYVLEFQSRVVGKDGDEPAQSQAKGTIRLDPPPDAAPASEPKYVGEGPVAYQTGPLPDWDVCKPLLQGQGTLPLRVFQAVIQLNEPRKIEIVYGLLGSSSETTTGWAYMLNFKCVLNPQEFHVFWSAMYLSGRAEAGAMPEKMFTLKDWTYVGQNGVVATKTLRSTCGGLCAEEVAVFTLKEAD